MTDNEQLQSHLNGLRALGAADQDNMLVAARMSYHDHSKAQQSALDAEGLLVDDLRILRERLNNCRSDLTEANEAIAHNTNVIQILEHEKAVRIAGRRAAE